MDSRHLKTLTLAVTLLAVPLTPVSAGVCDMDTDALIALIEAANAEAAAAGVNYSIEAIDCFTIGNGRPSARIHQQQFRWVRDDARRSAQGDDITFIVDDENNIGPASLQPTKGKKTFFPTQEVRNGMNTWGADSCLSGVFLDERPSPEGVDVTILDGDFSPSFDFCPQADLGLRGDGDPFAADIVHAGWYPQECFGPNTLAFSVTLIFSGGDSNGDGYLDTALNEVYYNDRFNWAIDGSDFDVQTIAFHESGHSLGVGHFGPPPDAVMNPVYAGVRHETFPIDHAGMCTIWSQWPNDH